MIYNQIYTQCGQGKLPVQALVDGQSESLLQV
jgi:hypothetical protein